MIIEIALLFIFILLFFISMKDGKNYPPGPRGWPILGSLMPGYPEEARKLFKKYGKIFMVKTGAIHFLYLADYDDAKECLSLTEFSDRPRWRANSAIKDGKYVQDLGLVMSNGEKWQHNRRFVIKHLKNLGMGKSRLEGAILVEIEELINHFSELADDSIEMSLSINISFLNIIFQLVASHRYELGDEEVKKVIGKVNEFNENFIKKALEEFFPVFKYLRPKKLFDKLLGFEHHKKICEDFFSDIQPLIENHYKTLDPNNPRDLIDDYLIVWQDEQKFKDGEQTFFDWTDLSTIILDLFIAGNDTSASTTRWILLFMAKYPSVQERVQKAIDEVVPRGTLPSLEHRNSLPIVDAVINEALRKSSFASFGLYHATSVDTVFKGYFIPKGTVVQSLAFLTHEDPQYWEKPEEFNPDRFLDASGKFHLPKEKLLPFGIGKRQCLGELMARMELYLFTAALLQNFNFRPPPGEQVDLEPRNIPMINYPKAQKLLITKRK